jgi:hypothetical protein
MSKFSTVYDTLIAKIIELFPDKTRISNPYSIEENKNLFLRDGWGLTVRDASESGFQTNGDFNKTQTFGIVFTKEVIRTESDTDDFDTQIKLLFEDHKTLENTMLNCAQLGIPDSVGIINFSSNTGVQFVFVGDNNFIFSETQYTIDIIEALGTC